MSITHPKTRRKLIYFIGWVLLLLCFYSIVSLFFTTNSTSAILSTSAFNISPQHEYSFSLSSTPFSTTPLTASNTTNPIIIVKDGDDDDDDDDSRFCDKITKYLDDQCDFANRFCSQPQAGGYLNYIQSLYCTFGEIKWLYFILLFLWLVVLFYLLSDTAENYFCPSLTEISPVTTLEP